MNRNVPPLVSIGLPVRNGAERLPAALGALLAQTYSHFELVISDNASQDGTRELCEEWARRDSRICYVRQPRDLGAVGNFQYVLHAARGPYFMWAADDDFWLPEYIAQNLAVLEAHPDAVCSVSQVEFVDRDGSLISFDAGTRPLLGSAEENVLRYLRRPAANSRFYGLFRTAVIRSAFLPTDTYWANDWVIMARTLMHGKHYEVPQCLMRRGARGMSSDVARTLPRFNPTWISQRLPMLPMTRALLHDATVPRSAALTRLLFWLNVKHLRHTLGWNALKPLRHRYLYPLLERVGLRPATAASREAYRKAHA